MGLAQPTPLEKPIKSIMIRIGDNWIKQQFAEPIPREKATERARQIIEALS